MELTPSQLEPDEPGNLTVDLDLSKLADRAREPLELLDARSERGGDVAGGGPERFSEQLPELLEPRGIESAKRELAQSDPPSSGSLRRTSPLPRRLRPGGR